MPKTPTPPQTPESPQRPFVDLATVDEAQRAALKKAVEKRQRQPRRD